MQRLIVPVLLLVVGASAISQALLFREVRSLREAGQLRAVDSPAARSAPAASVPSEPLSLKGAQRLGAATAPIVLMMFSDFECPYCSAFARQTLPAIDAGFVRDGKVAIVFRHFPLERIHRQARPAANAAECAGQQGQFWKMHDELFTLSGGLGRESFLTSASTMGLDLATFGRCVDESGGASQVTMDLAEAKRLGVSSTPTFFLGRLQRDGRLKVQKRIAGAQPFETFSAAIRDVEGEGL